MRMIDVIQRKRDGETLSKEAIDDMIERYAAGEIPDYQMSAWAMAVFFQGMNGEETAHLTHAMMQSGDTIDLSAVRGKTVDKHSTGGVGDTTTLVLGPLVASAGAPVAKMSGRGLGHTGGTIDKYESIPGLQTELTTERFLRNVNDIGLAVAGQTANLTPADKKLYGLRDVTATVDSIPLIASSVMSKKLASGADGIVLDVKTGSGAFMSSVEEARRLAETMVRIGRELKRETTAVISRMDQPLGWAVGNALEVKEAVDTLSGKGPKDLTDLCLTLGAHMLVLGEVETDIDRARGILEEKLQSGAAMETMKRFIRAQDGDPDGLDHLVQAARQVPVKAPRSGVIGSMDAMAVGTVAMQLGAGRETKESTIDLAAGIVLEKKTGDRVKEGDTLAVLHTNKPETDPYAERFLEAISIVDESVDVPSLIVDVIR